MNKWLDTLCMLYYIHISHLGLAGDQTVTVMFVRQAIKKLACTTHALVNSLPTRVTVIPKQGIYTVASAMLQYVVEQCNSVPSCNTNRI